MLRKKLNKIRVPQELSRNSIIFNAVIFLVLGILLGILSKWLDNLAIDDTIWWQHFIGLLDLRNFMSGFSVWLLLSLIIAVFSNAPLSAAVNVFLFLLGMTVSYHLYTVIFSGFNPMGYMMIWYGITLVSPILAFICWYARSRSFVSMLLSGIILSVMILSCFGVGFWYFDIKSILDTFAFIMAVVVLHTGLGRTIGALIIAVALAFGIRIVF